MGDRDTEWTGEGGAPLEGNRTESADPGRREVRHQIEDAEREARKLRQIPTREGNPLRRWK